MAKEITKQTCDIYLKIADDFIDVMRRDVVAIRQHNFNIQIYVVMIVLNGTYYGHIYTRISSIEPSYCIAMGIRGRVDNLFLKAIGASISNISPLLLEGVRRFALVKGADKILIPYPLDVMTKILKRNGFRIKFPPLPDDYVGKSISEEYGSCARCYVNNNLTIPFIDSKIEFKYL